VQFTDWCAPVKISNSAEYSVLQVLLESNLTELLTLSWEVMVKFLGNMLIV
jgi:hypothetical protein